LVLILKCLRQAFKWYHWHSDCDSFLCKICMHSTLEIVWHLETW
jgi:hypothetical protein